ncbi:PD40 domain-containing protein [Kibdelosporangium persicum]|uniref:Non-specific serine/threonine protein kinase n=1 Tax=Kibdelosporangium persicum TaxID=2698649 RepID=A0ABX2F314_9PSEU|nr:PD40 domain-containing protein [Kibdelosporangium persicum]NRN65263.1 Non-specific serine/threonine protein kinase [Kibdelosporangium persicum]
MPRAERPLATGDSALLRFAADLRLLRQKAGNPTYRELSKRAHFSVTTLSSAANGRQLPSLNVALAYVRACDGDEAEWEQRWHQVAAELAVTETKSADAEADVRAPYVGLAAFQPEDADLFHGREHLVGELTERMIRQRFVAVFGASGAGKSSLLRAGLVPRWTGPVVLFTPGPHPVEECAVHIARLAGTAPGQVHTDFMADAQNLHRAVRMAADEDVLIIVDQFEETFTLCRDEAERTRFVDLLLTAVTSPNSRAKVVLGVRADFYSHCTRHPGLVRAMVDAQVAVGPMTTGELRRAIVQPAVRAGCTVEGALLAELVAQAAGNAGVLPLLSHALRETWRRRKGNALTLAAFQAAGGVDSALARTAESVYSGLTEARQHLVRDLFLRLTALGEGTEDTKRRITRSEVDKDTTDVLDVLAEARLITVADETVEIAHEALIHAWPRLRQWLAADREGLRTHRHLTEAAQEWSSLREDPGALYRGARLIVAKEWAAKAGTSLNPVERAFLDASVEQEERETAAGRRRARQLRYLAVGLAVLLVVVTVISVVAVEQRKDAEQARQVAISRQLATQALTIAETDPGRAKLLSLEAYRTEPTLEARGALLSMSAHSDYRTELPAHTGAVSQIAFRPDGSIVSVGRDRTVAVWDPARRTRIATMTGHDTWLKALATTPDGRFAATGGDDTRVVLWDLEKRVIAGSFDQHTATVREIAFSPDGRVMASAGNDQTTRLWDVASRTPLATLTGHVGAVTTLAFSPDGKTLATGGDDQTIAMWDVASGTRVATLAENVGAVKSLDFSADGTMLASAGLGPAVHLWDVRGRTRITTFTGHTEEAVIALKFSRDGKTLVSAGNDMVIRMWDVPNRVPRAVLAGHQASVYTLAFSPDGRVLASAGEEGKIIFWDPQAPSLRGLGSVYDMAFTPDGQTLATAGPGNTTLWDVRTRSPRRVEVGGGSVNGIAFSQDGRTAATVKEAPRQPPGQPGNDLELWDLTTGAPPVSLPGHSAAVTDVALTLDGRTAATASADRTVILWDVVNRTRLATLDIAAVSSGLAFSPDGRLLAVADHDNQMVTLWDIATRSRKAQLRGHGGWARSVAFSPDGRILASASSDQTVILWDLATGAQITRLTGHKDAYFNGLAYSPDGKTIAYTSADDTVLLWDVERRTVSARLTGHLAGVRAVAFSPDSRTLATAGADGTIILWDTDPERVADGICGTVSRNLTAEEWAQFVPELAPRDTCPAR